MFEHGVGLPLEGKSDECAIPLQDQKATFDLFLDHIYGHSRSVGSADPYSPEELRSLLELVQKYRCAETRRFAINHIWNKRFSYHLVELIRLGHDFHILQVFSHGFMGLLKIPLKEISKEHHLLIGEEVFVAFVYAKAMLDEHCRIVACEEPVILSHASDCGDPTTCQEDWHAVWWNGMGRFLLDGRNPQPFSDTVKRFCEMQFGRMGRGCQQLMFQVLDCGVAFQYADTFVKDVCQGLVHDLGITSDWFL
ncbi:hypothetical protein EDD16DRAFT_1597213 [Pisolithus croceorrhizus]|nr:hypothetical protein EV401DRAFT_1979526 [Pisolithus croceorrhizus]KAI6114830.1 hypothetical protein EDD16DRAFT_1597213 [Pisolithus croceorrhizus]